MTVHGQQRLGQIVDVASVGPIMQTVRIQCCGDSMTAGKGGTPNNDDTATAYREYMQIALREMGIVFACRGSYPYSATGRNSMLLDGLIAAHGGAGYIVVSIPPTIDADATAAEALGGGVDVYLVLGGYNDYAAGHTVADVQAALITFVQHRLAANPSAWIFLLTSPPVVYPNASAGVINPLITAHNAMLATLAPTLGSRVKCVAAGSLLGANHIRTDDGVHPNGEGCRVMGRAIANAIRYYLNPMTKAVWPRPITRHNAVAGMQFTADTDYATFPTAAGLDDMGAGSFSMGVCVYVNQALAGQYTRIIGTDAAHYYQDAVIYLDNLNVLNAIVGDNSAGTNLNAGVGAVVNGKWHFLVLTADAASQICTLYCVRFGSDGKPCTILGKQAIATIGGGYVVHAGDGIRMGAGTKDLAWHTLQGIYRHAFVCKSKVMTAEEIENLAWDLAIPSGTTGYYGLTDGSGTTLAPPPGLSIAGGGTLGDGTLSVGAWSAAGSVVTPWDFGGDS